MGGGSRRSKKISEYPLAVPLAEIAKLPTNLRLEVAVILENYVDDLNLLIPDSTDELHANLSKIEQDVIRRLDQLSTQLSEFADKNKKITVIGTLTTTIAALGGFLAGAILAPFAPLALAAVVGHYVKQKKENISRAIAAGIVSGLAGILLIPFIPLLIAALPIINNTAIFNLQLNKIKEGAKALKDDLEQDANEAQRASPLGSPGNN